MTPVRNEEEKDGQEEIIFVSYNTKKKRWNWLVEGVVG